MRLDKFLVVSRLVKQRTRAKALCETGDVKVGESAAKAAREVAPGDMVRITFPQRRLTVEVLEVPRAKSVSKDKARELYKILSEERLRGPFDEFDPE
ncbi:MAG: RNA-binding S4 domain-containing protein [Candidatus Coatesbacteria bacterium]|nr:MAG: RNA-binding S4 domain-containing protein [Candidatus Coatesbacteria bacterium]